MSTVNDDNVGDFTNDLATDIGPLLALFGEKMTIQYLSESTSFLDYFIFAMAPIGILTGIVSVIRLCGHASLKAFIGRSQEGEGATEAELCTSTSRDVCELFTKGGVCRVLGRPSVLELIYIGPDHSNNDQRPGEVSLYLSRDYFENRTSSENSRWKRVKHHSTAQQDAAFAPNPNLSLNVGVRKQPPWVFWAIATIGLVLQVGVVVLAGTGVWLLGWNLNGSDGSGQDYAPAMYITGTVMLCFGMWTCAALIGQTTDEIRFKRTDQGLGNPSQIVWLQPGPQVIGDQNFDPFAYFEDTAKDPLLVWTSSSKSLVEIFEIYTIFAILISLAGFIIQFIGLRGMKGWVSLAQLGITVIMSCLRGILRIKRLGRNDNLLGEMPDLVAGHELDWLASKIVASGQQVKPFWHITGRHEKAVFGDYQGPDSMEKAETSEGPSSEAEKQTNVAEQESGTMGRQSAFMDNSLYHLRVRLAHLTGNISFRKFEESEYQVWEDGYVKVRTKAREVAKAICIAAGHVCKERQDKDINLRVGAASLAQADPDAHFKTQTLDIILKQPPLFSTAGWRMDSAQLEAALGLWIWTMISEDLKSSKDNNKIARSMSDKIQAARVVSAGVADEHWNASVNIQAEMNMWLGRSAINFREAVLVCDDRDTYGLATIFASSGRTLVPGLDTAEPVSITEFTASKMQNETRSDSNTRRFSGWGNVQLGTASRGDRGPVETVPTDNNPSKKIRIQFSDITATDTSLLDLCAQELFTALMLSLASLLPLETTELVEDSGQILLSSPSVNAFVNAFQEAGLGASSDAMLCVVPALRQNMVALEPSKLLYGVRKSADSYRRNSEWRRAETVLLWAYRHFRSLPKNPAMEGLNPSALEALRAAAELYRYSLARSISEKTRPDARRLRRFGLFGIARIADMDASSSVESSEILFPYVDMANHFEEATLHDKNHAYDLRWSLFRQDKAKALYALCFIDQQAIRSDFHLESALPLAVRNDWSEIVRALLEMNANANSKCSPIFTEKTPGDGAEGDITAEEKTTTEEETHVKEETTSEVEKHPADQSTTDNEPEVDQENRSDSSSHPREQVDNQSDPSITSNPAAQPQDPNTHRTALSYCGEHGYEHYIALLLEHGAAIDEPAGPRLRTPLSYAAEHGHVGTVELLVSSGYVNINWKDSDGKSSLAWAAEHGHIVVVKVLLLQGADLSSRDNEGWTPLRFASRHGHVSVVQHLWAEIGTHDAFRDGREALDAAIHGDHIDVVRFFLDAGVDFQPEIENGPSALSQAIQWGHLSIVRELLDRGADVHSRTGGATPIIHAVRGSHYDIVRLLNERGADPNTRHWKNSGNWDHEHYLWTTPLHWAIEHRDKPMVELLVDAGADIEWNWRAGVAPPLEFAIEMDSEELARFFISRGANPEPPRSISGPLRGAVNRGWVEMTTFLLGKCPNVDRADLLGSAAYMGHTAIAKILIDEGAQIDWDSCLKQGLVYAAKGGRIDCVRLLVEHGANLEGEDIAGWTPLRLALWNAIGRSSRAESEHGIPTDYRACALFLMQNGAYLDESDIWPQDSEEYIQGLKAELSK